jgi:hypothetical protein
VANLNQQQVQVVQSQNQLLVGAKGPLALRLYLDFAAQSEYVVDLQNLQATNQFDLCQCIYVDNADGGSAVIIAIPSSGQRIIVKAGEQGYFNVICPNPIKFVFDCAGGNPVTVLLINVAIPGAVWSAI